MTKSIIAGAFAAISLSMGADAGFTGYTVERVVLSNGNIQYKVYANFADNDLPAGQSWVFLNVYSHATVSGTMNAVHQDFFTADGEVGTWQAGSSVSAATRDFDSWVTSSGLATSSGWGTALDPGFANGGTVGDINNGAGWYDATPGTANTVTGGRMLVIQIVRTAANDTLYTANLSITYKVSGSSTPIQPGAFTYSFGIANPCAGGPDCNNNGCNDARDIATGSSADINTNGVPDECEPDCNNNDRPDAYDISTGSSADINTNGVPDECEVDCNNNDIPDRYELAQGLVPDCNADQIPDDCQGAARVALMSADLGSPSGADARVAIFSNLIPAESPVTIVVRAIGDLSSTSEFIEPTLNGVPTERLFETGANDCPAQPDVGILSIQPGTFNELISDSGTLAIRLACPITVDGTECKGAGSLTVEVLYTGIGDTGDCNGNERLDICELADSTSPDCNANLKPDSCDIASGFSADCDINGIPDSCDIVSGLDCNTNGVPDACDVAAGTSPDIDANNKPDECQTVVVNAGGSIQAAIDAAPSNEMRIINVGPGTYAGPINLLGKPIRLVGTAGPALTTITGTGGQNLSVVRAISGEPSISLVKGFTIQGGTTGGPLPGSPGVLAGGGVLFAFSSTSMADCVLQNNGSAFGAGAYLRTHDGSVTGCTFRNNTSQAYAGGLQLFDCTTTVSGCTFSGNLAVTAGGAMHMVNGQPKLVNCSFGANICNEQGGAMSWDPVSNGSLLSLTGCTISGNTASTIGGGIFIYPTGVASETQLVGTTVCGNAVRNISGPYQADATSTVCDCRADLNGDGFVNGVDLAIVLSNWDAVGSSADLTGDGTVNGADLGIILAAWGTCPST
jgi:hypothetical protein